jgi:hypothetical protein
VARPKEYTSLRAFSHVPQTPTCSNLGKHPISTTTWKDLHVPHNALVESEDNQSSLCHDRVCRKSRGHWLFQ